ncbi:MAG: type VII secretion protein EssC [Eubacteriales bacterium]|nr:type VII secretion protein EssC [Eubacteriales bacterium]
MEWKIWVFSRGKYEERTEEIYHIGEKYGVWIQEYDEKFYLCTDHEYYMTSNFVMKKTWFPLQENVRIFICKEETGQCIHKLFLQKQNSKRLSYGYYIEMQKEKTLYIGGAAFCQIKIRELDLEGRWAKIQWKKDGFFVSGNVWNMYRNGVLFQNEMRVKEHDFLEITGQMFYFKEDKLFFDLDETTEYKDICIKKQTVERSDYPAYICRARWNEAYPDEIISVAMPEDFPKKQESRLLLSLLPSLGMMAVMMLNTNGSPGKGGLYRISFGIMAILTAVVTWIYGKLHTIYRQRKYIRQYRIYLQKKERQIAQSRKQEKKFLERYEKSWRELIGEVNGLSWALFEKDTKDWDFLWVRLGQGKIEPRQHIEFQQKEEVAPKHGLWDEAEQMIERQNKIEHAPVILELPSVGRIGITGEYPERTRFLEMMLFQIACSHSEEDVKIILFGGENSIREILWMRFLPHIQGERGKRWIGWEGKSRQAIANRIQQEFQLRMAEKRKIPSWIVCCLDEYPEELYFTGSIETEKCGIYLIFLRTDSRQLPRGCKEKICLNGKYGTIIRRGETEERQFQIDVPERAQLAKAAITLSGAKRKSVTAKRNLPEKITLFELMEKKDGEKWRSKRRWEEEYETLPVPVGITENGSIFYLDLHEKIHGPHGLAAGTTGSGKSELILTYLLCAALSFPPWRLQFLVIDFKGGGLAGHLKGIPHLAGTITNLEEEQLDRSLLFIRAELKKRQKILAESGCVHVDEYEKRYRKKRTQQKPMPHLVIVVDEFAELKAEHPEFMKELISASRIGRSLGVHLILATQKPSGQVSEQIWSNAKFRLCLKVQSESDSREVLHCALASQIHEIGRGYFQVGNQEIFLLFQSAYSSEKISAGKNRGFQIFSVAPGGERSLFYERKERTQKEETQAEEIRRVIEEKWEKEYKRPLDMVCLEPLKKEIFYPQKERKEKWKIPIGIYDDPKRQAQPEAILELEEKNLLISGSIGSGKLNLFFVLLRAFSEQHQEEMEIYIADFEERIPPAVQRLPQIGGIVCQQEEEKLESLIEMMEEELNFRKKQREWSEQEKTAEPEKNELILIWFSYLKWKKKYPKLEERASAIWKEGIRFHIHTIIFQEETNGIGQILPGFGCRISLYQEDISVYRQLIDSARGKLPAIPGRAFFQKENESFLMQIYLAFRGKTKKEYLLNMEDWIWTCRENIKKKARKIPEIPEQLQWETYPVYRKKGEIPVAVKFKQKEIVFWSQWKKKITGICGEGQDKWIAAIADTWRIFQEKIQILILDDSDGSLSYMREHPYVSLYTKREEEFFDKAAKIIEEKKEEAGIILNGMEVVANISGMPERYRVIQEISKKSVILCTNLENRAIRYQSPELLQEIKTRGQILFFGEKVDFKLAEIPFGELKQCKDRKNKSEIFYWDGSHLEKWKIVLKETDLYLEKKEGET